MSNFDKSLLLLYAVTDRAWTGKHTLEEQVESALKGGVTLIQLREKTLDFAEYVAEAMRIKKICEKYNVPLIINDNIQVAIESGADGIHVGQEDMSVKEIRELAGDSMIVGATAKTVEQARRAEEEGADYIGVGAVFPSPTKTNAIRITKDMLKEICSSVSIPAVAIGGINKENMTELSGGGMSGVALVSAIFGAKDIEEECRELKRMAKYMVNDVI